MTEHLSLRDAQLLTLNGQGFTSVLPISPATNPAIAQPTSVGHVIDRLGLLQIDSVNVFERAHYLPLFSRLGAYDKAELDSLTGGQHPSVIEYWAHEASFIRTENLPLYKWRMDAHRQKSIEDAKGNSWANQNREFLAWLKMEIETKGPLTNAQIDHDRKLRPAGKGGWWGWSDVKRGLEWLFLVGDLVSGGREGFSRRYASPEQILPMDVLERLNTANETDSRTALLTQAARTFRVATDKDLADYHRMKLDKVRPILQDLTDSGVLTRVKVEGWSEPTFAFSESLAQETPTAPSVPRTTVVSPFDPLVWFRPRTARLFGFEYRIEIYTPKERRLFGYYTLPILHDGRLVGRLDLKSDRKARLLLVQAAWHEPGLSKTEIRQAASALKRHLKEIQKWQRLDDVIIEPVGNLASFLA